MSSKDSNSSRKVLKDFSVFVFDESKKLSYLIEKQPSTKSSWSNLDESLSKLLDLG